MSDQLPLFATAPVKILPSGVMTGSGAIFSPCGRYRFRLWRIWNDDLPIAVFMGQNPSKAGAVDNDQTISKCVGFARAWGCGGIVVVNPFALVETDSAAFERAYDRGDDVVGADNDAHVRKALAAASVVILACGGKAFVGDAADRLLTMVPEGVTVECLGPHKGRRPAAPFPALGHLALRRIRRFALLPLRARAGVSIGANGSPPRNTTPGTGPRPAVAGCVVSRTEYRFHVRDFGCARNLFVCGTSEQIACTDDVGV